MNPIIPPILHRLCGRELFDFITDHYICQTLAMLECFLVNFCDSGGDDEALKRCAFTESLRLISSSSSLGFTIDSCVHSLSVLSLIALMASGIKISRRDVHLRLHSNQRWYKTLGFVGVIRPHHRDETWSDSLW